MSVETWGIVLRDRASGAEQWVACEVAPLTIADAAARARSAAAQRAECDHRWVTTLDGLRDICMRCHATRNRETVLR